jgi:hypothetical protein
MTGKSENPLQKITVDGNELLWQIRHGWVHDNIVGLKGISISVCLVPGRTRELIIDFPFSAFGRERSPKQKVLLAKLALAIQAAIEGGWDPESRGRAVRYDVPEAEQDPERGPA